MKINRSSRNGKLLGKSPDWLYSNQFLLWHYIRELELLFLFLCDVIIAITPHNNVCTLLFVFPKKKPPEFRISETKSIPSNIPPASPLQILLLISWHFVNVYGTRDEMLMKATWQCCAKGDVSIKNHLTRFCNRAVELMFIVQRMIISITNFFNGRLQWLQW